jgi:hypothetical protein
LVLGKPGGRGRHFNASYEKTAVAAAENRHCHLHVTASKRTANRNGERSMISSKEHSTANCGSYAGLNLAYARKAQALAHAWRQAIASNLGSADLKEPISETLALIIALSDSSESNRGLREIIVSQDFRCLARQIFARIDNMVQISAHAGPAFRLMLVHKGAG